MSHQRRVVRRLLGPYASACSECHRLFQPGQRVVYVVAKRLGPEAGLALAHETCPSEGTEEPSEYDHREPRAECGCPTWHEHGRRGVCVEKDCQDCNPDAWPKW